MFAVVANRRENAFMFLPLPVCLAALILHGVLDDDYFLYGIAQTTQKGLCVAGDFLVLCRAPDVVWSPATSLLIIVNATALVSTLVCAAAMVMRYLRKTIVFRGRRQHKFAALTMLVLCFLFVWGYFFYSHQSFVGAIGMASLSTSAIDSLRYALASLLTQTPPAPPREKLRNGCFGPPLRRARFAPGVDTGEQEVEEDKR